MPRYALTENEFRTIESLITYKPKHGRPPTKVREMFDAIMWILCSGAPWRDLPASYPPWKSVYHRFRYYQKHGILEQVIEALMRKASKNRKIQLTLVCIDGSYIRAHRHAAGAQKKNGQSPEESATEQALGRSRGGFTTKIHLVVDRRGRPVWFMLTPGNINDFAAFYDCFKGFLARMERLSWSARLVHVAGDKGYDARRIRRFLRRRGLVPVIAKRRSKAGKRTRNPGFDRKLYRQRNVVERCLGWLKEHRRVATRYDKLAGTYSAMVQLACIRRLLPSACAA